MQNLQTAKLYKAKIAQLQVCKSGKMQQNYVLKMAVLLQQPSQTKNL
jgi:hypothetical protein